MRDAGILAAFEKADDAIQGIFGYFVYTRAGMESAPKEALLQKLPADRMPMTFHWDRYYEPTNLVSAMESLFLNYHRRICLIAIVSNFEAAVSEFWNRLTEVGKRQAKGVKDFYKSRLAWVFDRVRISTYGGPEMVVRIPQNCRHIDHARRLRNTFLHYNGLINKKYVDDYIPVKSRWDTVPDSNDWKEDPTKKIPILLTPEEFLAFYKAHLEILHQLHDVIQREDFGETSNYNYAREGKVAEWHRMLTGV